MLKTPTSLDLDIAVQHKDNTKLHQLLKNYDYEEGLQSDLSEFMRGMKYEN